MITRLLQVLIVLVPVALLSMLLNIELVPSGVFAVSHRVDERSPYIERILPDARILPIEQDADWDTVQPIVNEPAFFFVHPHRGFDRVDVEVLFKNHGVSIVELGGLARAGDEVYDLKPLQNMLIDRLAWPVVEADGVRLYQRTHTYDSLSAFWSDPPPLGEIATYHADLQTPYRLAGYVPSKTVREYEVSLRGFHEMKTYIKNEPLSFTFAYMDMNRDPAADPVKIILFDERGRPITDVRAEDDGIVDASGIPSELKTLQLSVPNLPEGVYKLELRAPRDIFWRRITTSQQKLVVLNNVYFGDEVAWREPVRSVRFYTEAKNTSFMTHHAEGVQELSIGAQSIAIEEPLKAYPEEIAQEGLVEIVSPRGDLLVTTDGHIAFSRASFFNPDPVRVTFNTDVDRQEINYVLTTYLPPEERDGWLVAHASFDTSQLAFEFQTWKFAFSIPGILAQEGRVDVGAINMTWMRPPFTWSDLRSALTSYAF